MLNRSALKVAVFRAIVLSFAVIAIGWAVLTVPTFLSELAITRAADRVMAGDVFAPGALSAILKHSGGDAPERARSSTLTKIAILQLRIAEMAVSQAGIERSGEALIGARQSVVAALKHSPSESFLWLALVWLDADQARQLQYLRWSYKFGPHEGWIAVRRSWFALKLFGSLPPDLAEYATAEFIELIRSHLYVDAAEILAGPGWQIRELLLSRTKDLDDVNRNLFAKILREKRLDELVVPNTEPAWNRQWQRD
jgi:hypothetical protein